MTRRIYWGLATLIILLIGVSAFLLLQNTDTEPKRVYIDVEPSMDKPPPAEQGYKWVWHHDHWDKVPIAQNPIVENIVSPDPVSEPGADVRDNETDPVISEATEFDIPDLIEIYSNPGELDISDPNFSEWMHRDRKATDDMMSASRLLSEISIAAAEANVDSMTEAEKKALIDLMISRWKLNQEAIKAYNKVSKEMPVK